MPDILILEKSEKAITAEEVARLEGMVKQTDEQEEDTSSSGQSIVNDSGEEEDGDDGVEGMVDWTDNEQGTEGDGDDSEVRRRDDGSRWRCKYPYCVVLKCELISIW